MTERSLGRTLGVGIATAIVLSAIMVPAERFGLSPMPRPLGHAFAEELFGPVPLAVGLLLHVLYVTFWSFVYVAFFARLSFISALGLGIVLWVIVLVVFFPFVGWGLFGLAVGPALIPASLAVHLLFATVLWLLCRWAFPR